MALSSAWHTYKYFEFNPSSSEISAWGIQMTIQTIQYEFVQSIHDNVYYDLNNADNILKCTRPIGYFSFYDISLLLLSMMEGRLIP